MARHRKYHVKHRRNPFGVNGGDITDVLWVSAGYVAGRAVPAMLLSSYNTGLVGYALNAAVGVALRVLIPGTTGHALMVGGITSAITRAVSDNLGAQIQGLSGDPGFTLGAYWTSYFAVPTVSDPYGRTMTSPYPAPALPAAPATTKGFGQWARTEGRMGGRFR
jgi:hypothetical protein